MKSEIPKKPNEKKYDLEERTAAFAEQIIDLCKKSQKNVITLPLIDQLIRSGTSVGANYCEANGASIKRDFKNKIYICKKEAKETRYWLRLLVRALPEAREDCKVLWKEASELVLIFGSIVSKTV